MTLFVLLSNRNRRCGYWCVVSLVVFHSGPHFPTPYRMHNFVFRLDLHQRAIIGTITFHRTQQCTGRRKPKIDTPTFLVLPAACFPTCCVITDINLIIIAVRMVLNCTHSCDTIRQNIFTFIFPLEFRYQLPVVPFNLHKKGQNIYNSVTGPPIKFLRPLFNLQL